MSRQAVSHYPQGLFHSCPDGVVMFLYKEIDILQQAAEDLTHPYQYMYFTLKQLLQKVLSQGLVVILLE